MGLKGESWAMIWLLVFEMSFVSVGELAVLAHEARLACMKSVLCALVWVRINTPLQCRWIDGMECCGKVGWAHGFVVGWDVVLSIIIA
jgi:hypothetical protein